MKKDKEINSMKNIFSVNEKGLDDIGFVKIPFPVSPDVPPEEDKSSNEEE